MATYIGTAISRIDGLAKVTGAAKYAGEFSTSGIAHASVVTSTIAKGRITSIDTSHALSVEGVIDVLTHQNRPTMASTDSAYKDDAAPDGSPFRPLYDDRIRFSGQPVALVVAHEPEIAASLRRWSGWNTPKQRTSPTCMTSETLQSRWKPRTGRAAPPNRRSPQPRCVIAASILSRSSITTRWNCLLRQ
jgi:hypothetical protein